MICHAERKEYFFMRFTKAAKIGAEKQDKVKAEVTTKAEAKTKAEVKV